MPPVPVNPRHYHPFPARSPGGTGFFCVKPVTEDLRLLYIILAFDKVGIYF